MTLTHLSHFGLTLLRETADNVVFEGSLAACRRMAFAHGMEVDRYEGRTVSVNAGRAVTTPASEGDFSVCWFKGSGLVAKTRDGYCLVLPQAAWKS